MRAINRASAPGGTMPKRKSADDTPKIGHNSNVTKTDATALKAYKLQHDQFDEQRAEIARDRLELRTEMREKGFDMKAFDEARRREKLTETLENATEAYQLALGQLKGTPLGDAAEHAAAQAS
jgi:uncharacterized protein (UPF0335 family)